MERVVNIINKKEEFSQNLQYWLNKSSEERLSAVQVLREQYIALFNKQDQYNESRKGLRRVCRVIKRTEG
jgi:hypothetical protein